jgi:tryptophan-rich sensory protein
LRERFSPTGAEALDKPWFNPPNWVFAPAALFIPYAAWVGFASVLNFEIARLN